MLKLIIIVFIFLLGMYFCATFTHKDFIETFVNENKKRECPDLLIQKGTEIFLFNSNVEYVPGINPTKFNNLEEYAEYVEWQRSQGLTCPVLFLQHSYDAQNKSKYDLRPSPFNLQGGLNTHAADKLIKDPKINTKILAFNNIFEDIQDASKRGHTTANAMDRHWGGVAFSRKQVEDGHFTNHNQDERFGEIYNASKNDKDSAVN